MNSFGFWVGIATLFIIGTGFIWVIRGERYFGRFWWPYVMATGILFILGSLFISNNWASSLLGAFGASLIWGSTELKEQAVRTEIGWYPFMQIRSFLPLWRSSRSGKHPVCKGDTK